MTDVAAHHIAHEEYCEQYSYGRQQEDEERGDYLAAALGPLSAEQGDKAAAVVHQRLQRNGGKTAKQADDNGEQHHQHVLAQVTQPPTVYLPR